MSSELQIFNNSKFGQVRTIEVDGKIKFVATDVAKSLGYKDPVSAVSRHTKGAVKHLIPTNGGNQEMNVIPEGDIYRLAAKSELPGAEEFESWIFDEVIPSIRKHGAYISSNTVEEMLNNPDFTIKLLEEIKKERAEKAMLQLDNKVKDQIIGELKPKADYVDSILHNKGLVTMTQIAKDYGMSAHEMNELLHELKVQFKQSEQWLLYQKYQSNGYTHSETIPIIRRDGSPDITMNTKWTQKGRLFIYNTLKDIKGIIPVIEREYPKKVIPA